MQPLLNFLTYVSLQTESLCLLYPVDVADVSGPYTFSEDAQNVIPPGSTCFVSACFTLHSFEEFYCSPSHSCAEGNIVSVHVC